MPLEIVKVLEEAKRPKCDIDFLDVDNERIFSSGDGGKIKVNSKLNNLCLIVYFSLNLSLLIIDLEKS